MNPDHGNGRDKTSGSFLGSLRTSFQQTFDTEKMRASMAESFEQSKQKGQEFLTDLMTQGKQKFEETRARIPALQQAPSLASQQIDKGVQELGSAGVNATRDFALLQPHPDDGIIRSVQKKVVNYGINKTAEYSQEIMGFAKDFSSGVAEKIGPNFIDNYNPKHVMTALSHPDLMKEQVSQRVDRLTTLYRVYQDSSLIQSEVIPAVKDSISNVRAHISELDGHGTESLNHGGRAITDLVQDKTADVIGTGAGVFATFNATSTLRTQTTQMKDWLFPKGSVVGMAARFPLTQFLFTNPVSKVMAHPGLAGGMMAYGGLASMGKNISDMESLKTEAPDIASRTKLIDASTELTRVRAVSSTSHKPNG